MKWRVILEPDPDTNEWAIWCPELPGCTSAGIIDLLPGAVIREVMVG